MADTFSTRGLKALFSYPFRHPNWERKIAVLALLCLAGIAVPILPWLPVMGFAAEIMRRSASGEGDPDLPEWNDWGRLFTDGLRVGVAGLIALVPLIIAFIGGFGSYLLSILGAIAQEFGGRQAGFTIFAIGGFFLFICVVLCGFILTLLIGILIPAAITHVAYKRSFAELFHVGAWWKVFTANIGGYLIGFVLLGSVAFVMQMAVSVLFSTVVLCAVAMIAPLVITPYLILISSLLFGQIYFEGTETANMTLIEPFEEEAAI
jgi:hypothetical protein